MGGVKTEKRIKKTKKRHSSESNSSKIVEGPSPSEYDDKYLTTYKNAVDAAAVGEDLTTNKSKKARRNKNKDTLASDEHDKALNQGNGIEPASGHCSIKRKDKSKKAHRNKDKDTLASDEHHKALNQGDGIEPVSEHCSIKRKDKSKKGHRKGKGRHSSNEENKSAPERVEVANHDVYQISSGDDDCSRGMKKWIKEYFENRPGLKMLQQRIDDFIIAHEEQEEQARREKEAKIAEDGWTVVVHRKGGKKTTDPESGVAVGSVAEAAVRDKMTKKKSDNGAVDFYRFQKKETKRNEIMQLQSKFEEDRKRIQHLRAARKFRPY